MSRAMWLAFGSSIATVAGLACTSSHTAPTASAGSAAEVDPRQDSGDLDARAIDAGDEVADTSVLTCDAGTGCACTPCGSFTCDTATEVCRQVNDTCSYPGCAVTRFGCVPRTGGVPCSVDSGFSCTQDSCGRVLEVLTIDDCCRTCPMGCATSGCYGSPPARLGRRYAHRLA
jgi:hypothetical protein